MAIGQIFSNTLKAAAANQNIVNDAPPSELGLMGFAGYRKPETPPVDYTALLSQFAGGLLDKPIAAQPAYSAYPMSPSASYAPNMVNYFGMPGAYAGTPFDYSQGMSGGMNVTPFNFSRGLL